MTIAEKMAAKLFRVLPPKSFNFLNVNVRKSVHNSDIILLPKRNYLTGKVCILNNIYTPFVISFRGRKFLNWPTPEFLPFTWERVRKVNPIDVAGDLDLTLPSLDPSTPKSGFELSEQLKIANEDVKKIFTLSTASQKEINKLIMEEFLSRCQRHATDVTSPEARIALLTVKVRILARTFKEHPRNKVVKVSLFHCIDKRNMLLRLLRQWDYRRFEWLLHELKITYREPKDGKQEKISRKGELRRLTREHCEKVKNEKLQKYHEKLKEQQEAFLKEKEDTLKWIAEEEKTLGLIESKS
ncbi:small ribosomal subunit protein uS15m [Centruroides vittatus]|uniref:small ribosomal subunit protein uS15m n=1 Tax=Centruroides vittatus TaxID=120091 RepID=UPI00350F7B98